MDKITQARLTAGELVIKTVAGAKYRYRINTGEGTEQLRRDIPGLSLHSVATPADLVGMDIERKTRAKHRKFRAYEAGYKQGIKDLLDYAPHGEVKDWLTIIADELTRKQKEKP